MRTSTTDLLKKVRKIELKTRALSHQIFAGEYHSAFKGRGMAFSEVREYSYGDDVRNMDWNVTARLQTPYVKVYEEEREMTVMLLIDISRSGLFGTKGGIKRDQIAELSAVLAFSAMINNDKVGALFFSDKIEEFIPPKKGRTHLLRIIRQMMEHRPESHGTDVSCALRFLTNAIKRKCTAFILSDMSDTDDDAVPKYEDALKIAVHRHDISVIRVFDPMEKKIPDVGIVNVKDSETGESCLINTSSKKVRQRYSEWFYKFESESASLFSRYNVDNCAISTDEDYVKGLIKFFRSR